MKERPILFSGPMVRAILEGRKTQTRRVVKGRGSWAVCDDPNTGLMWPGAEDEYGDWQEFLCPYGVPGDRLWVRETWCRKLEDGMFVYNAVDNLDATCCHYRADGHHVLKDDGDGGTEYTKSGREASPWSPSIHMPRWASRITLEVTGVRVERLQEISEQDAIAEGIEQSQFGGWKHYPHAGDSCACGDWNMPQNSFMSLWQSINGAGSWEANPWVWVIEFKRLEECP